MTIHFQVLERSAKLFLSKTGFLTLCVFAPKHLSSNPPVKDRVIDLFHVHLRWKGVSHLSAATIYFLFCTSWISETQVCFKDRGWGTVVSLFLQTWGQLFGLEVILSCCNEKKMWKMTWSKNRLYAKFTLNVLVEKMTCYHTKPDCFS